MQPPPGAPGWLRVVTAAERPDLWERARTEHAFDAVWPEYNLHGNHTARYFGAIHPRHAHLQALLVDERTGDLAGRARTIPFAWDGTLEDLPAGIDATGMRAVGGPGVANTLSALAGEVLPTYQGGGLSKVVIEVMAAIERSSGLAPLVAPVRPNHKHSTRSRPSSATWLGKEVTASPSTPGSGCTSGSGARLCVVSPGRWRSPLR